MSPTSPAGDLPPRGVFDDALACTEVAPGVYERDLDDAWWGWNGQLGGYLAALVLEALRMHQPDPALTERTLTVQYLRRVPTGRCRIEVSTERQGRTVAALSWRLYADGHKLCAVGVALFASDRTNEEFLQARPPDLTLPDLSVTPPTLPLPGHALRRVDAWPIATEPGFLSGQSFDRVGGWIRLNVSGVADQRFLVLAADAWVPGFIYRHRAPAMGGTIELGAYFREPVPPSVLAGEPVHMVVRVAQSRLGYIDEDAELWSADGRLLAQTRQLRYNEPSTVEMVDTSIPQTTDHGHHEGRS